MPAVFAPPPPPPAMVCDVLREDRGALPGVPLADQRRELFAQAVANGRTAARAYREHFAQEGTQYTACVAEGCRLLAEIAVRERVQSLKLDFRDFLTQRLGATRESLAATMLEIIETPVGELDESHPLAQEVRRQQTKFGEDVTIKGPSKIAAAEVLAKLAGFNAPEKSLVGIVSHPDVEATLEALFGRRKPSDAPQRLEIETEGHVEGEDYR